MNRETCLALLERIERRWRPDALAGDQRAIALVVRAGELRARLYGLLR